MEQKPNFNGINQSTQNSSSSNNSRDPSIVFGRKSDSKRESSKYNKISVASEDLRRSSNYLQKNQDGDKIFQETLIYDRRSDSLNHQQSLNHFINSKQNSEVIQEAPQKKQSQNTSNNYGNYQGSKSANKITHLTKDMNIYSHVSRNLSSIAPVSYASHKSRKKTQNQPIIEESATLQEDREPHASFLSDENGRIINEIHEANNRFFYKSGLKGIIFLVSESSHSAIAILPYFFSQFGILLSIILILTLITVSNYSFFYLLKAKNLSRRSNYHTIAQYLSGTSGYRFIFVVQFFTKFLNCTMLMYFAAKQLQQFILNVKSIQNYDESQLDFTESYQFYLIMISMCMIALSLFVVISHQTTFTQLINVTFLLTMIILTLISFITTLQTEELKGDYVFTPDDFKFGYAFSSMSVLLFLLDIHINFFNVYKFMRKPSDKKMLRTSLYANMVLGLCFIFIGSFGYITTTDLERNVNYLVSFSQLDLHITFSSIALIVYVLYCLINFPLQFSIARTHLLKFFKSYQIDKHSTLECFPHDHLDRDHIEQPQFYKSSSQENQQHMANQNNPISPGNGNFQYHPQYDMNGQLLQNETFKHYDDSNLHQTQIQHRQIRFYAVTVLIFLVMFLINFFLTNPLLIVLFSGVFFSSVNAFIIPIAFYIKLSNYESTFVVIISVLMLFTILGLDFTTLLGQVYTLIE